MSNCDQELCPMWDGDGCPCAMFGLDKEDLPSDGVFWVEYGDVIEGWETDV